jgi:oxygen-independent coproporphyrinogen-3 oxidase
MTAAALPLGLYVHLPWCVRKCPYCDFNSYELRGELPEAEYVRALLRDLDSELPGAGTRSFTSIFIGGGTPSLFSGTAVAALLDGIRERAALAEDVEITLEANPGAVDAQGFAAYRQAGVNRLSIGVQSLRDAQLTALGRVHDAAEAKHAVAAARQAGFASINLDLMYGLPGDTAEGSLGDLECALALGPTHLSWYQLTLEPQTHFERFPPALPDDDFVAAIEAAGRQRLAEAGFERYEVSAYARPGYRCRHNLNYWQFGDYLGIGAGAHGKLSLAAGGSLERRSKTRNPRAYVATAGTAAATRIDRVDAPESVLTEFLMNALRLVDGVSTALLTERTGLTTSRIDAGVAEARRRGWLLADTDRLCTTPAGLQSLNRLLTLL